MKSIFAAAVLAAGLSATVSAQAGKGGGPMINPPPSQPLTAIEIEINTLTARIAGYQQNLQNLDAATGATKEMLRADQASLAALRKVPFTKVKK